jgi:hypothetical protein
VLRLALVLATAMMAAAIAAPARADGDPASDYLIAQPIFWPIDAPISGAAKSELASTVARAKDRGFEVRVALIWSEYDLGSVRSLWRNPQRYARFLAAEITYFYKGRLLVAMPNGLGFVDPEHGGAGTRAVLDRIRIGQSPTGLTQAAAQAVTALAAARGIEVHAAGGGGGVTTKDVLVGVGLALVLVPVAALALFAMLRRRPPA